MTYKGVPWPRLGPQVPFRGWLGFRSWTPGESGVSISTIYIYIIHRTREALFYILLETSWDPCHSGFGRLWMPVKWGDISSSISGIIPVSCPKSWHPAWKFDDFKGTDPILRSLHVRNRDSQFRQVPERIYNLPNISCKNALCVSGSRRCFQICSAKLLRREGKWTPKQPNNCGIQWESPSQIDLGAIWSLQHTSRCTPATCVDVSRCRNILQSHWIQLNPIESH